MGYRFFVLLISYCGCPNSALQVLVEGLRATNQRMMKHVTPEGQLLGPLWDKLSDTLFAMFSRYVWYVWYVWYVC